MSRKGYLLATAGSVAAAATAGGAQAADMPLKAPVLPAPAASWAGWYIGLNAGVNWQLATNSKRDPKVEGGLDDPSTTATGFIGGGQMGYNFQDGNFVWGLEGDIDGLTGKGRSQSWFAGTSAATHGSKNFSNQIQWLSTIRARTGLAVGNTMAYVTGGLAIGGVQNSWNNTFPGAYGTKSESKTQIGWAFGGGIEHILWNSHWTVALEGLFVDLGKSSATIPGMESRDGTTLNTKTARFSNQALIGRFKLNYKF